MYVWAFFAATTSQYLYFPVFWNRWRIIFLNKFLRYPRYYSVVWRRYNRFDFCFCWFHKTIPTYFRLCTYFQTCWVFLRWYFSRRFSCCVARSRAISIAASIDNNLDQWCATFFWSPKWFIFDNTTTTYQHCVSSSV